MYSLEKSYGKQAYVEWCHHKPRDLSKFQTDPYTANADVWQVGSFRELLERVSFLTLMNKRLSLFFRGQTGEFDPIPTLFRDAWTCFGTSERLKITPPNRSRYWHELEKIGQKVYEICDSSEFGLPRWRGLRDFRETQWAIIQHYGIWPTPMIDITNSLRVASSFALEYENPKSPTTKRGYVFVVGMPNSTGSITFDADQHICLARLQSTCPPIAKRPHLQDGFLVSRFPIHSLGDSNLGTVSRLARRLVAKFELMDRGDFWDADFPVIGRSALLPEDDRLNEKFMKVFGPGGDYAVCEVARAFTIGEPDSVRQVIRSERITINPHQCGGRPCVRGMRIRVTDVLDLLASGLTREQVLEELPDLEPEDVEACLRYASSRI